MKLKREVRYNDRDLIVGNGTIITYNTCIPLNAVSAIQIRNRAKGSITKPIIMLIVGCVMAFIPTLSLIGGIIAFCGLALLLIQLWENSMQKYGLVIQVHAGTTFTFEHKDLSFIRKIADIIREALDDNAELTYIDMRRTEVQQNFKGKNSFYSLGENNSFGNVIIGDHNHYKEGSHDTTNSNNTTIVLTVDDWNKLERYFRIRSEELGRDHQAYTACKEMERYAKQKDAKGLRKFFTSVGKGVLTAVLAKAAEYGLVEVFHKLASISI